MSYYLQPEHYDIAEQNGISATLLYHRVYDLRMNIEEACTKPVDTRCYKKGLWDKWKDVAVVCYGTFSSRIRAGKDEYEAAMTPPMRKEQRAALGRKSRKQKISEAQYMTAEMNGITRSCASYRVNQLKWDIERAVTEPVRKVQRKASKVTA